jgi:hypothetical protein
MPLTCKPSGRGLAAGDGDGVIVPVGDAVNVRVGVARAVVAVGVDAVGDTEAG